MQIKRARLFIKKFLKKHKRVPKNLSELRLFSYDYRSNWVPYDGYAQRFFYKDLSRTKFLIRSEALATKFNEGVKGYSFSNILDPPKDILYQPGSFGPSKIYPAEFLEGSAYPGGRYVAKLFRNPVKNEKTLVAFRKNNKSMIRVAPHSGVEEFVWINKSNILYTASGDRLRPDNIYLWDLAKDVHLPLLNKDLGSDFELLSYKDNNASYFFSISSKVNNIVFIYIEKVVVNQLNPLRFYSPKNLFAFRFSNGGQLMSIDHSVRHSSISHFEAPLRTHMSRLTGYPIQRHWSSLPVVGDPGRVIENWQNFAIKYSDKAIFPYSLYLLSCLYHDSFHALKATHPKSADPLLAFGVEIAGALMVSPAVPSYLRAMGRYNFHMMREKEYLGFDIGQFSTIDVK